MIAIDKDVLIGYYMSGKSSLDIADTIGCCPNTITDKLRKCGITIRTLSEAQIIRRRRSIPISSGLLEVFDGLLLGDGNLSSPSGNQAVYHQDSSEREFIDYVADILNSNNYLATKYNYGRFDKRTKRTYHSYSLNSVFTVELQEQRNRWYKKDVKVIPLDLAITPVVLMMWYLSDGHKDRRCSNLIIATESFRKEEVNNLIYKLSLVGIPSHRQENNRIRINADGYDVFMSYVGGCPIGCYQHKFS